MSTTRMYLRASTADQDELRAEQLLLDFVAANKLPPTVKYAENASGTKLDRPRLNLLLEESDAGDILLVESVDRLSRLSTDDWESLKHTIKQKGIRLVVVDLQTTHQQFTNDNVSSSIMNVINGMLIDLLATMARLDQEKRVERIKQGIERSRETAKANNKKVNVRGKDEALRKEVAKLLKDNPKLPADKVALLAGCGVASIYRIKKEIREAS